MNAVWQIAKKLWVDQPLNWSRGLALSILVLVAGVALLGLSGWFITSAGVAGLIGAGLMFDFFRPSAGVRFLALGRTITRYGERLLTHDATLKSLASLRVRLLKSVLRFPYQRTLDFRSAQLLNRLTADVDTLDTMTLRLLLPLTAASITLVVVTPVIAWLTDWRIAVSTLAIVVLGVAITLISGARSALLAARNAEAAFQQVRQKTVDLVRSRTELIVYGQMPAQQASLQAADEKSRAALQHLDQIERRSGFALQATITIAATTIFILGAELVARGSISMPQAALALFATIALTESLLPLRRGFLELGRITDAAARICQLSTETSIAKSSEGMNSSLVTVNRDRLSPTSYPIELVDVTYRAHDGHPAVLNRFSLAVPAGKKVALVGPSGCGKSTVLLLAAGLQRVESGRVMIEGRSITNMAEQQLRQSVAMLPQRSSLMSGSIRDVLCLGSPDMSDDQAWEVLEAVALDRVLKSRGGLGFRLDESGAGLSGGEQRRLALARALLRRSPLLLLDEPTEGLDQLTAERVLRGIDRYQPDATILIAAHRSAEVQWADLRIRLHHPFNELEITTDCNKRTSYGA